MTKGPLNIDEQIAAMRITWPSQGLTAQARERAIWRGELRPLFQKFEIEIDYEAPSIIQSATVKDIQPLVRIISPPLKPRPGDPEGELPHVYYVGKGPLDVVLCLLDPDSNEWSSSMNIAETTVPWTIDWLVSYEGWRATGIWTGGGRHIEASTHKEIAL